MPEAGDLLALDRRHQVVLLLLLGAEQVDRRGRHVRVDRDAHAEAAAVGVRHLLGEHERAVVVAALAAVLLGVGEAEEAQLAHALEDPVREGGLLPLLRVRAQLLDDEVVDRLAELVVLVGEDEVLARAGVVGLQDIGCGGHGGTVPAGTAKVNSGTSHFPPWSGSRGIMRRVVPRLSRSRPARPARPRGGRGRPGRPDADDRPRRLARRALRPLRRRRARHDRPDRRAAGEHLRDLRGPGARGHAPLAAGGRHRLERQAHRPRPHRLPDGLRRPRRGARRRALGRRRPPTPSAPCTRRPAPPSSPGATSSSSTTCARATPTRGRPARRAAGSARTRPPTRTTSRAPSRSATRRPSVVLTGPTSVRAKEAATFRASRHGRRRHDRRLPVRPRRRRHLRARLRRHRRGDDHLHDARAPHDRRPGARRLRRGGVRELDRQRHARRSDTRPPLSSFRLNTHVVRRRGQAHAA